MTETGHHRLLVCTSCRHKGDTCAPGLALMKALNRAMNIAQPLSASLTSQPGTAAGYPAPERDGSLACVTFEISGVACMAGCGRPCTIAYQASGKATYLFGDIDAGEDIEDLVAFARQYQASATGWFKASERPGKLRHTALARVPAMVMVSSTGHGGLQ